MVGIGMFNVHNTDRDAVDAMRRRRAARRTSPPPPPFPSLLAAAEKRAAQSGTAVPASRRETNRAVSKNENRETDHKGRSSDESNEENAICVALSYGQCYEHRDQQGQSGGQGMSKGASDVMAGAPGAGFDTSALAEDLAPLAGENGIFEVLLPCGSKLGVVVNTHPAGVRFLLSSSNLALGRELRRQQMELEGRLERRIGRNVALTVL